MKYSNSLLTWVFLQTVFNSDVVTAIFCTESYECAGEVVSDADIAQTIGCYGYSSCNSSPLIRLSRTPTGSIDCGGSKSCQNASIIERAEENKNSTILQNAAINCWGFQSCAFVKNITNEIGDVRCWGQNSCINSTIIVPNGNFLVAYIKFREFQDDKDFPRIPARIILEYL